jgi:hypothetical protein
MFLHNGMFPAFTLTHAAYIKVTYQKLQVLLYQIYNEQLNICGDIKLVPMLTEVQSR